MDPDSSEDQGISYPPPPIIASHISSGNSNPSSNPNSVVDQTWICPIPHFNSDFFCCPICFQVIFNHVECPKCERLLCSVCTKQIQKTSSACPLCKHHPWNPKKQIHLSYRQTIAGLLLKCKICQQELADSKGKQYNLKQLSKHLTNVHNIIPPGIQIYQRYSLVNPDKEVIKFSELENLQIMYNSLNNVKMVCISHQWKGNVNFIKISLEQMKCKHPILGTCKVKAQYDQNRVPKKYDIWTFQNDYNRQQFYTTEQQKIIEENYQAFLKNQNFNQFMLDILNKRYRLNFEKDTQTNTVTEFERGIKRINFTK